MLRLEILKLSGKPFSGEPHEYHCLMNVISNKLKGIELEAWDILTVLHSNSTGKPKNLLSNTWLLVACIPIRLYKMSLKLFLISLGRELRLLIP